LYVTVLTKLGLPERAVVGIGRGLDFMEVVMAVDGGEGCCRCRSTKKDTATGSKLLYGSRRRRLSVSVGRPTSVSRL